jgi:HNH endonuclease
MWQSHRKAFAKKFALTKQQAHYFFCTAEHLEARCDGGKDVQGNIVAACKYCNLKRHQLSNPLPPDQYSSFVKSNMEARNWFPIKPEQVSRLIAGK